jgi:hypothetical protein
MDWKSINCGALTMHRKFKYMPTAFDRTDIACVQVLLNLITILVISKSKSGAVMAFVEIFCDVPA